MSLLYFAKFKCDLNIREIAQFLVDDVGLKVDPTHGGRIPSVPTITLQANEFQIDIAKVDLHGRRIFKEDLEIEIDSQAVFAIGGTFLTQGEGGQELTRSVTTLLRRTHGDFAFLFEGELVLLLRNSSGVAINSKAGFWNPSNRGLLPKSVLEKPLPSI